METQLSTDQLGRVISLPISPRRIISLVPSQTELLFELGLDKEIIGITKFCIHPKEKCTSTTKIGGTKQLNLDKIRQLKPDLIIGNKEENDQSQIEILMNEFPVWMSDIHNLSEALTMIRQIGHITGKTSQGEQISKVIEIEFENLHSEINNINTSQIKSEKKVAYFIWKNPFMIAGKETFIDDMIIRCGLKNAFSQKRYPQIVADDLRRTSPDVIFLSSEPYPFKEKHLNEFQELCPDAKIRIVDGELFSWYGSRLIHSCEYFKSLFKQIYN